MDPQKVKEEFPIFQEKEDLVYLDNAATSQKPQKVIDRVKKFYECQNSNVGRGLYDLANEATVEYKKSRKKVAKFVGADSSEIVFVRNTTEAENLLAETLEFEGDIVLSEMAHHSEQLPWRRKAEKEDKEVEYLETGDGRISVESAKERIGQNTGIVAFSQVSNVFGTENPVEEIVELAHENNALVVLDGAQSVPHKPVDVKDLDVDFLCFSGHKMLGPSGIGALYGKKEHLKEMKPYQVGGGAIQKVTKEEVRYEDAPEKFEPGTPNVAGAAGLAAAIEYLENVGMEEIYSHDKELAREMIEGLQDIEGVNVVSPESASLVSFTTDFAHPHDVAEILNQNNVAVRAGHHCAQPQMEKLGISGTTRAAPYLYNTKKDVEEFLNAVEEVREVFKDV